MSKTIMLIHGAWLNAHSWEGFKARYEAKGYTVVAPSWPLDDRSPAELRAAPHPELKTIGINAILDHYDRFRAFAEEVGGYVASGALKYRETVVDGGIEAAPQAFIDMLRGANTGKMVVRLG